MVVALSVVFTVALSVVLTVIFVCSLVSHFLALGMLNLFSCSLFTFVVPTVPGNTTEDLLTINIGILYDLYCWMLIGSGKILEL